MNDADWWLLALSVGLLLHTSMLALIETVVSRTDVVRALRLLEEEERRGAEALLWLVERRSSALNVLMVMTVSARVVLAAVATVLAVHLGGGAGGVVVAVVVVILASLVIGEAVPRTIALRHLEPVGLTVARHARVMVRALDPLARLVVAMGRVLVPRRHEVSGPYASDDELRELETEEGEVDEELEPEERAMIRSIFELGDTIAREVMVPRPDMITVPRDASLNEVVRIAIEHGTSRIPVHDPDEHGSITGTIYAKDLLRRIATDPDQSWSHLIRPPTFVPETQRCDDLLRELQAAAVHLAIVVDEYGEVVGLVTIEDILEEIVGEIVDEHDREDPLVEVVEGGWRVDARLGVDDLNELLGMQLPEEGWDTVGGLVFGTLGRVPGEQEVIDLEGIRITVERVQGRRVASVTVTRRDPSDHATSGER